ncbi:MAG: hypothetical protein V1649_02095 [Patescibacteria group bacterium]
MKKVIKVLLVITILFASHSVFADTRINLQIKTNTDTVYSGNLTVTPCDSEGDGIMKATPYCALVQSDTLSDWAGLWINSINNIVNNDGGNGAYWMWLEDLNIKNSNPTDPYNLSSKQYTLEDNDKILFFYNTNPLKISVEKRSPIIGESIKITVKELGTDLSWNPVWNNATGGKVVINGNTYDLDGSGEYSFQTTNTDILLIKGQKDNFIDSEELSITPTLPPSGNTGMGAIITSTVETVIPIAPEVPSISLAKQTFDLKKAFEFIISQQKENGSFGEDLYTDWTALALASGNYQGQTIKLIKYFGESEMMGTLLTDYERHAMALMALGLNPYNNYPASGGASSENYIKKIISSFDGKQFGDVNEDNDDIFALIVLQNAGFTQIDKIINDDINFILSKQKDNGSWDNSVDMTGASIGALAAFSPTPGVGESLVKAKEFLKQNQKNNGGWNNVSSTAWVLEGILALGEKPEDWKKNGNNPFDYLATIQDTDEGIKNLPAGEEGEYLKNKLWETAYTVTALSGKTWNQIMQKFEKPKELKEQRTILKKLKSENLAKQNAAAVINSITLPPTEVKQEIPKKSWFRNLLDKIFSIF